MKIHLEENEPKQKVSGWFMIILITVIFASALLPSRTRGAETCPSVQSTLLSGEFINAPVSVFSGADTETVECSLKFAPPSGFSMYAGIGSVQIMCITRSPWKFTANGYIGSYQTFDAVVVVKFEDDAGFSQVQRIVVGADYRLYPYTSSVVWVRQ